MQYTTPATGKKAIMYGSIINSVIEPAILPNGSKMYIPTAASLRYVGRYWGPNNTCAYFKFKTRDIPERAILAELEQIAERVEY